jgi:predicted dehydrogenase
VTHGVVLVGLGAIGMGYDLGFPSADHVCTHARAFRQHTSFGPVAGVDPDANRQRLFDAEYGGPSYGSVRAALEAHQPSVVVIASPTATHPGILNEVLEYSRPQLVLCEKPLATDPLTAGGMVELCRSRGVALYVNYMRRADPGAIAVRDMIRSGDIRAPIKGVVWYSKGLIHNGSHFVDLMRYWMGSVQFARLDRCGRRWEDRDPEPDFTLDHAQSSSVFLAANEECFSHYTVELVARNGRLRYEEGGARVEWQGVVDDPGFAGYRVLDRHPRVLPADMMRSQLNVVKQLARALQGQTSILCSGLDALETLRDVYRVLDLL